MAHCVISSVVDTDHPLLIALPACVVHAAWAPCDYNHKPANPRAIHTTEHPGGREDAILRWRLKTHGQRPLVLHHGDWAGERDHDVDSDGGCWCGPEVFAAHDCDREAS